MTASNLENAMSFFRIVSRLNVISVGLDGSVDGSMPRPRTTSLATRPSTHSLVLTPSTDRHSSSAYR